MDFRFSGLPRPLRFYTFAFILWVRASFNLESTAIYPYYRALDLVLVPYQSRMHLSFQNGSLVFWKICSSNLSIFACPHIFEDERDLSSEEHRLDSTQVLIHGTLGKLNKMQKMCLVVKSPKPSPYAERAQAPVDSTEFLWDQKMLRGSVASTSLKSTVLLFFCIFTVKK